MTLLVVSIVLIPIAAWLIFTSIWKFVSKLVVFAAVLLVFLAWWFPLGHFPFGGNDSAVSTTESTPKPVTTLPTTTREKPDYEPFPPVAEEPEPIPVSCEEVITGSTVKIQRGKWRLVKTWKRDGFRYKRYKRLVVKTPVQNWRLPAECPKAPKKGKKVLKAEAEQSFKYKTEKSRLPKPAPKPPPAPSPSPSPAPTPPPCQAPPNAPCPGWPR